MKYLIVFALVAVIVSMVSCDFDADDMCETDNHCEYDECCMKSRFGGNTKFCQDKGDDIGDPCGGEYHCSTCDRGLECVRDASGFGRCQRKSFNRNF